MIIVYYFFAESQPDSVHAPSHSYQMFHQHCSRLDPMVLLSHPRYHVPHLPPTICQQTQMVILQSAQRIEISEYMIQICRVLQIVLHLMISSLVMSLSLHHPIIRFYCCSIALNIFIVSFTYYYNSTMYLIISLTPYYL